MTPPADPPHFEVYAIAYARCTRSSRDYFLGADPHDGPAPITYYVWLIRNADRVILLDTGFNAAAARKRGREFLRCPTEGLRRLGVAPEDIETVVISHLHYDHAGNLDLFPNAEFILQDAEMRHATGRHMRHGYLRAPFELSDVLAMVTHNFAGRVRFVDGDKALEPGIGLYHLPGHSLGLQAMTVETARGRLCLAADALHFFDNLRLGSPFAVSMHLGKALDAQERALELAGDWDRLIPGHDPVIGTLYPAHPDDPLTVCLHEMPLRPLVQS